MAGIKSWSTTAASNVLANTGFTMDEGQAPSTVNDSVRQLMADVRTEWAQGANIASATTTDLSAATGGYVHITGTTTITGFGTVSAGIRRKITFDGALTLTHNATSLILPTGASITTVAGDTCEAMSEGSGNWRVLWYAGKNVQATTIVAAGGIKISAGAGTAPGSMNLSGGTQFQIVGGTGGFAVIDSTDSFNNILISDAGNTTIRGTIDVSGAASGQISFPATQNASAGANVLDDYEEGTWTPSLGGNATYTVQTGTYTKIGRMVFIRFTLTINVLGTGSSTTVSGLPFTSIAGYNPLALSGATGLQTTFVSVTAGVDSAAATVSFNTRTAASASEAFSSVIFINGSTISVAGCYQTT